MGFRRTIQLAKIKDRSTKRYIIRYSFFRKDQPLFEQRVDIHDLIKERGWKSISFAESMEISQIHFGITFGKYPLITDEPDIKERMLEMESWSTFDVDGFTIGLSSEDLAIIRNKRIDSLGIE
jgi:hypothetical protein